jgi:hypothetical protein
MPLACGLVLLEHLIRSGLEWRLLLPVFISLRFDSGARCGSGPVDYFVGR